MARVQLKAVSVSGNRNSFGLAGAVLMAQTGEAWEVGANHLKTPKQGDVLEVSYDGDEPEFSAHGFEIPRRLPVAPHKVVREVWGDKGTPLTALRCKALVVAKLRRLGLPAFKLSAKTVSFQDLARASCVFVTLHEWSSGGDVFDVMDRFARARGFRVQAK